ncbi:General transcription factor IIH subunit 2 [Branchiostoma belcheri]|nr:General transcription factor IIH subunit 2 [Branchiostoma belcheri]
MADEEVEKTYRWEGDYEKTWEVLQEDAAGSLQASVDDIIHRAKRRRLQDRQLNVRLGMMRHLFVVVDMSQSMEDQDLKPARILVTLKLLENFIEEYFDQNPISQLGVITTKNKRAEKLTDLGGNPKRHITQLKTLANTSCVGEPSIMNSLDLAAQTLKHMPTHTSREVLIIMGSLTTCDPGDINITIKMVKDLNIRCSVIGLAAEVQVCKKLCSTTNGTYGIILEDTHFKDLLLEHCTPPPATIFLVSSRPMTSCESGRPPLCHAKYCELPVECKICGLTLVSAPHLARSYHHFFPLENFREIPLEELDSELSRFCTGCQVQLKGPMVYCCTRCTRPFCIDCDLFIHETLHSCPGCINKRIGPNSS